MLLTMASGVALSVAFIALSTMLRYKFNLWNNFLTSTPCNRRSGTHVSTYYLILFMYVYQQRILSTFAALLMGDNIRYAILLLFTGKSFDFSQELIVPLHLVNHLAVDIFDVEILTGYDESADATSIVIQSMIVAMHVLVRVQA